MKLTLLSRTGRLFISGIGGAALLTLAPYAMANYPQTAAEAAANVTPTNDTYEPGDVRRYGAVVGNCANNTTAFATAISTGHSIFVPSGTFDVQGGSVVVTTAGQAFRGESAGKSFVRRCSNGPILTISARNVDVSDVSIVGDSAVAYSGDNIVVNDDADNLVLRDLNVYNTNGNAVNAAWVDQFTIRGGLYNNEAAPPGTPVVTLGRPGQTNYTYYWVVDGITLQPSGNPLRVIDSGSGSATNSQLGGLELLVGSAGSVSNRIVGNRITGNIRDQGSNSTYVGNAFGAHTATFEQNSSGILWTGNVRGTGSAIVNNGLLSNMVIEQDRVYSGFLNLAVAEGLRLGNNKPIRFYNPAGTNYGSVSMTTANNLTFHNNTGSVQVAASASNRVQNIVGGVEVARFDDNATAGQTRFFIYDVDNGTLERVSVGAPDSGGVGYKVLRIPN